ncbi:cytochrome P450 [Streptomyces xanthii]|uniref:cytochrome P450 n=1 Tax=Streptomyces xanthii TaxID=2768069 RepID=UPI001CB7A9A8|nr:cytochrome P450 [Streptomyces xanthii]
MTPPSQPSQPHAYDALGDPSLAPPPGCPAHALGPDGLRRLYGPEADEDLAGVYEKLRAEHGPVAPVLIHDDVRMWAVLGHGENLHMVRSTSQYNRDARGWTALKNGTVKPTHPLAPVFSWQPICSMAEGAEHLRLRGAVSAAIATIEARSLRRTINKSTQIIINRFSERGTCEVVSEFAEHLPMMVMLDLLGAPEAYSERFVQAARDMIKGTETAIASNEFIMGHLMELAVRRRADPIEDDFTSTLITDPAGLTDDEVGQHLRLVLIAAYEATANLIANVLRVVLTDPRFRAQLNGGQMTVPEAVEQSLWDEPPFSAMVGYFAKVDTELGGQHIRAGDGLIMGIQPGNADPVVRPEPGAHMMGNRSHLAFGGGPHECPGQDIGRAIADIGVDAFLMRLPDAELAVPESELRWRSTILSQHLVALPVEFTPRGQQDVVSVPSMSSPQRTDWQVSSPGHAGGPGQPDAMVPPQPGPAPAAAPAPAGVQAPAPGERLGAWQRFLRWWRGY